MVPEDDGIVAEQNELESANLLSSNLLSSNLLSLNLLSSSSLTSAQGPAADLAGTAGGRELLRYVVRCAYEYGHDLQIEADGTTYSFPGLVGLAPSWDSDPLSVEHQQRVSACLLAHVNAFGVSVPISLRNDGTIVTSTQENLDYSVYEATFFGAAFDGAFAPYACLGTDRATALAQSDYRELRICADPQEGTTTSACGFETLGPCEAVCDTWEDGQGWSSCWTGGRGVGTQYEEAINVWLRHN